MPNETLRARSELGQRLFDLRQEAGITQEQVARLSGLCHGSIQGLEAGTQKDPRLSTLIKLCRALGTSLQELLGHDGRN